MFIYVVCLLSQILPRIGDLTPGAIVIKVEDIIAPLDKILEKATKDGEGSAEKGNREMLKTTLRAMIAIHKIEDVRAISRKWNDFMEKSKKNPKLVELFHSFENENLDV
jgi:hypothetical protein